MRRDVFQAIADPVRRDIIGLLSKESLKLNAIAANFDISRPGISKHIKILEECGVVTIEKKGRERHCSIKPSELSEVADWVNQYRWLWDSNLDSFDKYITELHAKRK